MTIVLERSNRCRVGTTDPPACIGGRKASGCQWEGAAQRFAAEGHGARLSRALELGRHLERIHHELYVVVRATSPERSKPDSSDQRRWRLRIVQRCDAGGFDGPSPSRLHIRSDQTVLRRVTSRAQRARRVPLR